MKVGTFERPSQKGFSLVEVLVGVAILGIVYATLFGLISGSLRNVGRIEERERIVRFGQMKMNELIIMLHQGDREPVLSGKFGDKYSWQANIEMISLYEGGDQAPAYKLAKIRLSVKWSGLIQQDHFDLETSTWVPPSS